MTEHSAMLHPAATDHLPFFITTPGQSDGLFNAMVVFLIVVVFAVGLIYLRIHALPEHLAHGNIQAFVATALWSRDWRFQKHFGAPGSARYCFWRFREVARRAQWLGLRLRRSSGFIEGAYQIRR